MELLPHRPLRYSPPLCPWASTLWQLGRQHLSPDKAVTFLSSYSSLCPETGAEEALNESLLDKRKLKNVRRRYLAASFLGGYQELC